MRYGTGLGFIVIVCVQCCLDSLHQRERERETEGGACECALASVCVPVCMCCANLTNVSVDETQQK